MAAVLTWLAATPVAFLLPDRLDRDPFATGATILPLTVAFCLVIAGFAVTAGGRVNGDRVAGVAAGLAAGWITLALRFALTGTPFGFGGLVGDMSRTTAAATRYTTTLASSDTLVPELPAEYPPLYTWLVGRAAVLLGEPTWRLLADFEVLFMSAALLAGFLLWRRLVPAWVALALSAASVLTWSDPRKAYEVLTLVIFVPWILDLLGRAPRRRMHWLVAGLVGGFIAITYQAWLVYAAPGLLGLAVLTWRGEPDRRAYLRHLALTGAVTGAIASWYVVPFVWAVLTLGGDRVSDRYVSASINDGWFPFLTGTPLGMLQLVGLVGLVWLARSAWWARPLLLLVVGVYAYRLAAMVRYLFTGHTAFLHYTGRLYAVLFTVAGVLVVIHVTPPLVRRLRLRAPALAAPAALAVALCWAAATFTVGWLPEHGDRFAVAAHTEPLPGGDYPRYAPAEGRRARFPVPEVRRVVREVRGPQARPVALSVDDRLFAYLPWPGYLDNDRTAGSTLSRWDERHAELRRVVAIRDPAAFTTAIADTRFGPIDVLVLRESADGWRWRDLRFAAGQFDPVRWSVFRGLPGGIVVAVRRP
jgi:hypothetical protein